MTRSIVSPDDQKVTWVELFFDLVFVFSVTQVVSLLHDGITFAAVGRVILLFWLVWWAWTQFTWALNAADTTHHSVQIGTLGATAVAFFMAVALPVAFGHGAPWFAAGYVVVRAIGLALYVWVASADRAQRAAVIRFSIAATAGLVAVIAGGYADTTWRYLLWGAAIVLDIISALVGGETEGWNLHPEHFAERHGLFVIIALGETLIVAASGAAGVAWTADLVFSAILAVSVTAAWWWIYFVRAKPMLDASLEARQGMERSSLGRDVFSLLHFPIILGVIAYAAIVESAMSHPHEALTLSQRATLAAGFLLYAGGMALAARRARLIGFIPRATIVFVTGFAVIAIAGSVPAVSLLVVMAGAVAVAIVEHRHPPASRLPLSTADAPDTSL